MFYPHTYLFTRGSGEKSDTQNIKCDIGKRWIRSCMEVMYIKNSYYEEKFSRFSKSFKYLCCEQPKQEKERGRERGSFPTVAVRLYLFPISSFTLKLTYLLCLALGTLEIIPFWMRHFLFITAPHKHTCDCFGWSFSY